MTTTPESSQREQLAPAADRRLYRSNTEKVLAGICGGLGEYFAVDPVWFRIGFVLLALGGGSGILIYLLMWLIVPPQPEGYSAQNRADDSRGMVSGLAVLGIVLIFVGTITLFNTVAPWLGQYFWPIIFVVGGLALIAGGVQRDTH
jgi:phage shock protein C